MNAIIDEFPQPADLYYLNHAAVAPWPARSARAVERFARENIATGARDYSQWLVTVSYTHLTLPTKRIV